MRRVLGGDRFWRLSMGLPGEVGALVILLRLMGRALEVYLYGVE